MQHDRYAKTCRDVYNQCLCRRLRAGPRGGICMTSMNDSEHKVSGMVRMRGSFLPRNYAAKQSISSKCVNRFGFAAYCFGIISSRFRCKQIPILLKSRRSQTILYDILHNLLLGGWGGSCTLCNCDVSNYVLLCFSDVIWLTVLPYGWKGWRQCGGSRVVYQIRIYADCEAMEDGLTFITRK